MNDTLKKYELMKELQICIDSDLDIIREDCYYQGNLLDVNILSAILERACREWLETQEIFVIAINPKCYGVQYFHRKYTDTYHSFDAAQIAALEWCLKENSNGKESENENTKSNTD